jgi:hypothetical protein
MQHMMEQIEPCRRQRTRTSTMTYKAAYKDCLEAVIDEARTLL